jgi:hypothetical protein
LTVMVTIRTPSGTRLGLMLEGVNRIVKVGANVE